ncbi:MAG: FkbM family methyltransferase [Nonlabens sp.]
MSRLKVLIANLLVNQVTGRILRTLYGGTMQFEGLKFHTRSSYISPRTSAALFFKSYESAEVRFIKKYINGYKGTIIELGSSIGVVANILSTYNPQATICGFEADGNLCSVASENLALNGASNATIYHEVLKGEGYVFKPGKYSTDGKIVLSGSNSTSNLLVDLITRYQIDSPYTLVCDIEGAEYFILNDMEQLNGCEMILIELHDIEVNGTLHKAEDLMRLLSKSFELIERYGNVVVYGKC